MNNTEKATMDAARRMIKGGIDLEEVSLLMNLPMEKLLPIKEELEEEVRKVYGNLDHYDFSKGDILFDNFNDLGNNDDILNANRDEDE